MVQLIECGRPHNYPFSFICYSALGRQGEYPEPGESGAQLIFRSYSVFWQ